MDPQFVFTLSGLPRYRRRARRIQRQVHGEPVRAARLVAGDAGQPHTCDLSQFLLSVSSLAIHGAAPRRLRRLTSEHTRDRHECAYDCAGPRAS